MDAYLGMILPCCFNFAPEDWMLCNGAALSINDYQQLYAVIGTNYGGDGVSTFKLPNLQGRVPIGFGQYVPNNTDKNPQQATFAMGQTPGSTIAQVPVHDHDATLAGVSFTGNMSLNVSTNSGTASAPGTGMTPAGMIAVDNSGNGFDPPVVKGYGANANTVQIPAIAASTVLSGSHAGVSFAGTSRTICNHTLSLTTLYASTAFSLPDLNF